MSFNFAYFTFTNKTAIGHFYPMAVSLSNFSVKRLCALQCARFQYPLPAPACRSAAAICRRRGSAWAKNIWNAGQ